jgi:hypothetical protein
LASALAVEADISEEVGVVGVEDDSGKRTTQPAQSQIVARAIENGVSFTGVLSSSETF